MLFTTAIQESAALEPSSEHLSQQVSAAMDGPWWALLIPLLPLAACALCGLCAAFRVKTKLPGWLSVAFLAASFVVTVALLVHHPADLGRHGEVAFGFRWIDVSWGFQDGKHLVADFAVYIDSLTLFWMLFVTGLATLIALYATEYMEHDVGKGYSRFFAAFCLFVFSMACLVMGDNLLLLYLGWEGVGLCSYLLIGYFYKKPSAVEAAKKAFIVNRIGDLGLALGIMLTFVHFGSVKYVEIFAKTQPYIDALKEMRLGDIPTVVQIIPILFMIGAAGKSAQFPLYVWLPDAMEGPTPVSALIHAATMVTAGVYLVARAYPLFLCSEYALPIVAWTGTITALLAATIGMAQFDIKRIMAYSTCSQLGYMFAGLGVLTSTGAAYHVLTHAFFKALLFLACGAVMHGFAGQLDLRKLSGVRKIPGWGLVGVTMLIGCLNLSGFPLITSGFWSKDMILAEAFTTPGYQAIGWILLITAGLTAYYTFRVYFRVFEGPVEYHPGDELHADTEHGHDHGGAPHAGHAPESHPPGDFHPHAPGWAIKGVLATLAVCTFLAIGLYFLRDRPGSEHGGWAGAMINASSAAYSSPFALHGAEAAHEAGDAFYPAAILAEAVEHGAIPEAGAFLGMNPHSVMYYVSALVGFIGIGVAFFLHLSGRTSAATSKADALVPYLGPIVNWARNKWYVDEFYNAVIRLPLLVLAHICHLIDKLLVDGLVDLAGFLPRGAAGVIRPSQSGLLHGYAIGMAGGIAVLLIIVLIAMH